MFLFCVYESRALISKGGSQFSGEVAEVGIIHVDIYIYIFMFGGGDESRVYIRYPYSILQAQSIPSPLQSKSLHMSARMNAVPGHSSAVASSGTTTGTRTSPGRCRRFLQRKAHPAPPRP